MVGLIKFGVTLAIIVVVTSFLPVVETLPYGMDEALTFFVGVVNALLDLMPWFVLPWNLVLIALLVKSLLFIFHWSMFFVNLFSGGSSAPGGR